MKTSCLELSCRDVIFIWVHILLTLHSLFDIFPPQHVRHSDSVGHLVEPSAQHGCRYWRQEPHPACSTAPPTAVEHPVLSVGFADE